jgi:hypothetical protein
LTSRVASTIAAALDSSRKKTPSWETRQCVCAAATPMAMIAATGTAITYARARRGSDHTGQCRIDAACHRRLRGANVTVDLIPSATCRESFAENFV